MEQQKVLNLLNEVSDSKFVTRKWNMVNDQSNANYDVGNETIYNAEALKFDRCDYKDAYILVRDDFGIIRDNGHQLAFKYCAPFTKCIARIYQATIDDADDAYIWLCQCIIC